jgi:hypothetical protein
MEAESFDLLQGHEFGDGSLTNIRYNGDPEKEEVLVWNKAQTIGGHQPAAREVSFIKSVWDLHLLCFTVVPLRLFSSMFTGS